MDYMDASSRLDQQSRATSDTAAGTAQVARTLADTRKHYEEKLQAATDRAQDAEAKAESLAIQLQNVRAPRCQPTVRCETSTAMCGSQRARPCTMLLLR